MRYLALALLVACGPRITASTPRSVTVDGVNESTMAKATEMAQAECEKSGRDAELASTGDMARGFDTKAVTFKCVDRVTATTNVSAQPAVAPPAQAKGDERKVVVGDKPLFCAVTAPDVGACSLDEVNCNAEGEKVGAPKCEQRTAGSCFNATKTLDGTKLTVCAVSIKDCESRRQNYAANPDYTVTACGIYRAK